LIQTILCKIHHQRHSSADLNNGINYNGYRFSSEVCRLLLLLYFELKYSIFLIYINFSYRPNKTKTLWKSQFCTFSSDGDMSLVMPVTNSFDSLMLNQIVRMLSRQKMANSIAGRVMDHIVNIKPISWEFRFTGKQRCKHKSGIILLGFTQRWQFLFYLLRWRILIFNEWCFNLIRHGKLQKPAEIIIQIDMSRTGLSYRSKFQEAQAVANTLSWDQFYQEKINLSKSGKIITISF